MLKFDEKKHIYTLDGMEIPSVTTVMKPLSDSVYGSIDQEILDRAAERGTAVHTAIENHILFGIDDVPAEYDGYFKAFLKWNTEHGVKPESTEIRLYHRTLMYAGTADMIAEVDGKHTLIDFKTSTALQPMLYGVQLEAYERAMQSLGMKKPEMKMIVHLQKTGKYQMIPYKPGDIECWKVFTALLTIRNYKQKFQS